MRFITANQIFSGKEFFSNNTIIVLDDNGKITELVEKSDVNKNKIETFNGIICPGFINTHCHLELSHLKNVIPQHTGIVDFGLAVISERNKFTKEQQQQAMQQADAEMRSQGIVAVGDISNTSGSITTKQNSDIFYHTFVELIALNPERASIVFDTGKDIIENFKINNLNVSLAPHAPYSTSLQLIQQITNLCFEQALPSSIHNQESNAENEFFKFKTGNYIKLYNSLNLLIDYFNPTGKSSLQSIIQAINSKINMLLVHNTFTNDDDIKQVQKTHSNLYWCLCPNANLYIENTLPNSSLLLANNCTLTLGTDSLASNTGLSIINEINTIQKHQPNIDLKALLQAATYNGAKFLGIQNRFGLIDANKKCGLNLIEGEAGNYSVKKLA